MEQLMFSEAWERKLVRILKRDDDVAREFVEFAKGCVLRFTGGVPPYRKPATKPTANWSGDIKTGVQIAEALDKALLEAERCLSQLLSHNVNDPSFFLKALSRVHQKGQSPEEIRGIIGREPFTGKEREIIPQFSALSSLLRAASMDMSDKWHGNLKAKKGECSDRPGGKPLDALALDIALGYRRILGEIPESPPTKKYGKILNHLLEIAAPDTYKNDVVRKARSASCKIVEKRFQPS